MSPRKEKWEKSSIWPTLHRNHPTNTRTVKQKEAIFVELRKFVLEPFHVLAEILDAEYQTTVGAQFHLFHRIVDRNEIPDVCFSRLQGKANQHHNRTVGLRLQGPN